MPELLTTVDDQIATITLNRPQHDNAINLAMWQGLADVCSRIETNPDIRVVIVRGAGEEAFSTGGDISEFSHSRSDPWQAKIYNGKVEMALQSLLRLGKPTIALVKGHCVGSGCMLAAHCDLRMAADNSVFGLPMARLGMLIGYSEMQRFVHLIGAGSTLDLLLTARLVDAQEARAMGLCNRVFPLAAIDEAVYELAQEMADLAPLTQRWHKQMIQTVLNRPDLSDLSAEEVVLPEACLTTQDYVEGIRAFLEKRSPHFHGK